MVAAIWKVFIIVEINHTIITVSVYNVAGFNVMNTVARDWLLLL